MIFLWQKGPPVRWRIRWETNSQQLSGPIQQVVLLSGCDRHPMLYVYHLTVVTDTSET